MNCDAKSSSQNFNLQARASTFFDDFTIRPALASAQLLVSNQRLTMRRLSWLVLVTALDLRPLRPPLAHIQPCSLARADESTRRRAAILLFDSF